jgi:hypothetical protein
MLHPSYIAIVTTRNKHYRSEAANVLSIVTMEYAHLNVGDIAHVKTLSKICTLQLRGWLQRVWEEGV